MIIGDRLRALRDSKNFSREVIEKKTGLHRCYISRVENGYTIPGLETLEKFARALEVPIYLLFYDGEGPPRLPIQNRKSEKETLWGSSRKDAIYLARFWRLLGKVNERDRMLLLRMAQKMSR